MNFHAYELSAFLARYDVRRDTFDAVLKELPALSPSGPWLAGGALRRLLRGDALDSDWDFFFASEQQAVAFEGELLKRGLVSWGTKHASTYTGEISKPPIVPNIIGLHRALVYRLAAAPRPLMQKEGAETPEQRWTRVHGWALRNIRGPKR